MLPVHERVPDGTILPALDQNDLQVLNLAHIFGHVHRLRHRSIQQPGAGNRYSTLRGWQCNPPFGFQHPQRLHARCPLLAAPRIKKAELLTHQDPEGRSTLVLVCRHCCRQSRQRAAKRCQNPTLCLHTGNLSGTGAIVKSYLWR